MPDDITFYFSVFVSSLALYFALCITLLSCARVVGRHLRNPAMQLLRGLQDRGRRAQAVALVLMPMIGGFVTFAIALALAMMLGLMIFWG